MQHSREEGYSQKSDAGGAYNDGCDVVKLEICQSTNTIGAAPTLI
jgi:hypothetical protein